MIKSITTLLFAGSLLTGTLQSVGTEGPLKPHLGKPHLDIQPVFRGERFGNIVVTMKGTVVATWGTSHVRAKRSEDGGKTWGAEIVISKPGFQCGGLTVNETNGDIIAFVEDHHPPAPISIYRSSDDGKTWEQLSLGVNNPCPVGIPRTTNVIVDPRDTRTIWAGIEVDGVYKSLDGGDNWVHLPELGPDAFHGDIHGMTIRTGPKPSVHVTSPFGIAISRDEGESWDYSWSYLSGRASRNCVKERDPHVRGHSSTDTP